MSLGFASNSSVRQAGRGATLGTATSSFVGVVRVDATTMIVDANGTISVDFTSVNSSIANLSSVSATNIADLSSVTTSSIAYLSSVAATRATSSVYGVMRTDGTSLLAIAGLVIPANASNGFGARTVQSSAAGAPSNSTGNIGDIIYQY